ncbi:MAG TPA: cupredoxin domain-containing protein [Actinomycetota bacterium]|nr:cupredoxin domain-containing protein [Actinomycetota bacterium]
MSAPTHRTLGRLVAFACVLTLGAACTTLPQGRVQLPQGRDVITMVPDSVDDVGLEPSITVDANGVPYLSYFGFAATLGPDEIPVSRPIGSPYLQTQEGENAAAVLLTTLTPDTQVWNRGAVAQPRPTPAGVTVPFGPAEEPSLSSLSPATAAGTDVAVAGTDVHVTWASDAGVFYGLGPDFQIESIEAGAGAGGPAIAVGEGGAPIVAYTKAGLQPEVRVAERVGERWTTTPVTTLSQCGSDCPPPTDVGIVGGEPIVVVTDPATRELIAARRQGDAWSTEVIATGVVGGASLATTEDAATVAYYTPNAVAIATGGLGGGWSVDEVATVEPAPEPSPEPSPSPTTGVSPSPAEGEEPQAADEPLRTEPATGIAVDGEGTVWVAWEDAQGVHLASGGGGAFEEQDLGRTEGGVTPTVGVTEDGSSVYLGWFDPVSADLLVAISAELDGIVLAAPSPTAPVQAGGGTATCGEDGEPVLEIAAQSLTFDTDCLVAPAGEPFTITFDNQDAAPITHNVAIYPDQTSTEPIFQEPPFGGPQTVEYDVPALDADEYAFRCDVHPTTMSGTLAVVEGGGGGGGNGGGQGGDGGGNGGGGNGG